MKKALLLSSVLIMLPVSAFANPATIDIDVHVSTLGYGAAISKSFSDNVSARLSFNQYNRSYTKSTSDANSSVDYAGDLKLGSVAALADWHMFSGYTHLTAGLIYNNNEFTMNSVGTYTLNGVSHTGALNASVTFNKVAPYLGIGWSGRSSKTGFSFKSDIGVMFQGKPKSTLTTTDATVSASDLATEQANMDESLNSFRYYPVISVGLGYAF